MGRNSSPIKKVTVELIMNIDHNDDYWTQLASSSSTYLYLRIYKFKF